MANQNGNGHGQYRQVQISTASPGRLVLLLYQGAIRSLKKSIPLIDKKDYEGKGNCLINAQDIVMELNLALDMRAGEVSASLRRLYLYIYHKLIHANLNLDKKAIRECIDLLEELYEAWQQAVQQTEGGLQTEVKLSRLSVMG